MIDKDATKFVVRKRNFGGGALWWIGMGSGKSFVPYADIFAPCGYGYHDKDFALLEVKEIEERLGRRDVNPPEPQSAP